MGKLVLEDLLITTTDVGAKSSSSKRRIVELVQCLGVEIYFEVFEVQGECGNFEIYTTGCQSYW